MYCFNPKLTFSKKSKTKIAYLAEGCKFCMKWYILVKLAHLIKSTQATALYSNKKTIRHKTQYNYKTIRQKSCTTIRQKTK